VVLAVLASVLVGLVVQQSASRGDGGIKQRGVAERGVAVFCTMEPSHGVEVDDFCLRVGQDLMARLDVTPEQEAAISRAAEFVQNAEREWYVDSCVLPTVNGRPAPCQHVPKPVSVEVVRGVLVDAGFREVMVRIARDTDPAPTGSTLFAGRLVGACFVGYRAQFFQWRIAGLLPDGTCLTR
jgi:hypothetical protein